MQSGTRTSSSLKRVKRKKGAVVAGIEAEGSGAELLGKGTVHGGATCVTSAFFLASSALRGPLDNNGAGQSKRSSALTTAPAASRRPRRRSFAQLRNLFIGARVFYPHATRFNWFCLWPSPLNCCTFVYLRLLKITTPIFVVIIIMVIVIITIITSLLMSPEWSTEASPINAQPPLSCVTRAETLRSLPYMSIIRKASTRERLQLNHGSLEHRVRAARTPISQWPFRRVLH